MKIFLNIFILMIGLVGIGSTSAYAKVGEVIFAIGASKIEGSLNYIRKGDSLEVGQTIITSENGHVHIRFEDDAFVSIRPGSTLKIERYHFDIQDPNRNEVKFTLTRGTSRLITGKAGQANKKAFRLNTPVAAIGIRGTDFIVQTDGDLTRVAVQQGAVTVAAFGQDCLSNTLGPCAGPGSRNLAGSMSDAFLEVKAQGELELIRGQGRRVFALPRPEEPPVSSSSGQKTSQSPSDINVGQQLIWGRWSPNSLVPAGYELIGQNDAFVLYRNIELLTLPTSGFVDFTLTSSQAYGRVGRGGYEGASIDNAMFSVNFEKMLFQTSFDWTFNNRRVGMFSRGEVSADGRLAPDSSSSNVSVSGALSGDGDTAAYIFNRRIGDTSAYGLMYWQQK